MKRPCPVCGGEDRTILFHQTFSEFSGKALLNGYDVTCCNWCGCGFADGIPGQAEFDAYYRDLSKYEYQHRDGAESAEDQDRFQVIAKALVPFIPSAEARILEVGCATGRLLWQLRQAGYPHVAGLDPSPSCAATAQRLYGVEVRIGTLHELLDDGTPVDMLILIGVLEHLCDLQVALKALYQKLALGGRIYIEVPDVTGFERHLDAPYQQFSTEHLLFFSRATVTSALAVAGFRPLVLNQDARPHSGSSTMPVLWGVFEKTEPEPGMPTRDLATCPALEAYIQASGRLEENLARRIDGLVGKKQPLFIWGVGTLTRRLLATTRLGEVNIVAFIDSNPNLQGQSFQGIPVLAPSGIDGRDEAILIASWVFADEIEHQIRAELGYQNAIIRLGDNHQS